MPERVHADSARIRGSEPAGVPAAYMDESAKIGGVGIESARPRAAHLTQSRGALLTYHGYKGEKYEGPGQKAGLIKL